MRSNRVHAPLRDKKIDIPEVEDGGLREGKPRRRRGPAPHIVTCLLGALLAFDASARIEGRFELRPAAPSPPPVGSDSPIQLVLDDGGQEGAFGLVQGGSARQFLWFNRFDAPADGEPFLLEEVHVLFPGGAGIETGAPVEIVLYRDPDGDPANGAVLLGAVEGPIQHADDSTFSVFPLRPPVVVHPSSPVLVGVVDRFVESGVTAPLSPASLDRTTPRGSSWLAVWATDPPARPELPPDGLLAPIDGFLPGAAGNWMIRAFGGPLPAADVPALSPLGLLLMALLIAFSGMRFLRETSGPTWLTDRSRRVQRQKQRRPWLGAGLLALLAVPASADAPFTAQQVVTTAEAADTLVVADLDRDGDLDFVAGAEHPASLAWFENLGGGSFSHHLIAGGRGIYRVAVEDIDRDGDLDIAAAEFPHNALAWYENNGNQGFSRRQVATITQAAGVAAVDLDRDGDVDLLSSSQWDDLVIWYENDGNQAFTEHVISSSAEGARSVAAADFDGDGDMDVLAASTFADKVAWYENDGSQAFTEHLISASVDGANHVMTVDLDRDGDVDALSASLLDDKVAWYENDGRGTFSTHVITRAADGAYTVDVADLDGDGDLDVLSASFNRDGVAWYENDGNQGFTRHVLWESGVFPFTFPVAAGDFDGDGDIDVLSASERDREIFWFENRSLHRSALFPPPPAATGLFTFAMARADVDGDGDLDIMYNHPFGALPPRWGENASGDGKTWTTHTLAETTSAYSLAPADVDGDGSLDMVVGSADRLYWYRNAASDGSSWTRTRIGNGSGPARNVAAADIDRDGDPDVLAVWNGTQRLSWYENPGDGSEGWTERTVSSGPLLSLSLIVTDLDGDGDADALTTSFGAGFAVLWFENTSGDGSSWSRRTIDGSSSEGFKAHPADVDRDGDLDVVAAVRGNSVAWYENTAGDGSAWTAHPISGPRPRVRSSRVGDLDGDGDVDVATDEGWYENLDGMGGAWAGHHEGRGTDGVDVEVGDFDGDGDLDLLDQKTSFRRVEFLENRGGQFALQVPAAPPIRGRSGGTDALPPITVAHRGRPGDGDLEIAAVSLFFDDGNGTPFSTAELQGLAESFSVYLDDGSGAFEAASDRLLASVSELPLVDGLLSLTLPADEPDLRVALGAPKTYFLVAHWRADAAAQPKDGFQVDLVPEVPWAAVDADFGLPLTLERPPTGPVTVEINDPPTASEDVYTAAEDLLLTVPAPGILANDLDEEDDPLSIQLQSAPGQAASFSLEPDGSFSYRAVEHWSGTDAFTYRLSDGLELSQVVAVEIFVDAVADLPSLAVSPATSPGNQAVPLSISSTLADGDGSEELSVTVDNLPAGATLSAGTDLGGGRWSLQAGDLPGLTLSLPAGLGGSLTFTVTATATETSNGDSASRSAPLTVTVGTDLQLRTVESADPVVAGSGNGNLVYTTTLTNAGPWDATGVEVLVTTLLPAGVSLDSTNPSTGSVNGDRWSVPFLASGTSATLEAMLTVAPEALPGTDALRITAVVESLDQVESSPGDETATEATSVAREADLRVSVTESLDPVTAGSGAGNLLYRATVANAGPSDAGDLRLSALAVRPAGVLLESVTVSSGTFDAADGWILGSLPAGTEANLEMVLTVGPSASPGVEVISFSSSVLEVNEVDPAPGNEAGTEATSVLRQTDLAITKDDGVDAVPPGGTMSYVLEVRNLGPSDAPGATVADPFPPELACTWTCSPAPGASCTAGPISGDLLDSADLPAGARVTYTAACSVSNDAEEPILNVATVTAGPEATDPFGSNDSDDDRDEVLDLDWGDAPDEALGPPWAYPTLAADDGARHGVIAGFHLGEGIDAENDGLPSAGADGDDLDSGAGGGGGDDEDGVAFPTPWIACEEAVVEIVVSAPGLLDAWADFDGDGVWTSEGEQIFANEPVFPSRDGSPRELVVSVPCSATPGETFARFRFSSAGGLAPTGVAADGEVEDHRVEIRGLDFGDAADPSYPTLLVNDGARHGVVPGGPVLGLGIDAETDGRPSAGADGDDVDGLDDEDGVRFASPLIPGLQAQVEVIASAPALLDAWIDFAGDGGWSQEGDRIFSAMAVEAGTNLLSFSVPVEAGSDLATVARFRISTTGTATFTGLAADGEVEDVALRTAPVTHLAVVVDDGSETAVPGTTVTYTITVTNGGPDTAVDAVVQDDFPPVLSGVSWSCVASGRGSSCTAGPVSGDLLDTVTVEPGGRLTYTATGTLDSGATGTLTNTARITTPPGSFDPLPDDDVSTDTSTLTPETNFTIVKDDGLETAVPGTALTYTIVVDNAGPSDAVGARVTDFFPAALEGAVWTCAPESGAVCTAGPVAGDIDDTVDVPAGASLVYTATATVAAGATGQLVNTARVASAEAPGDPEEDSDVDELQPTVDLAVVLDDGSESAVPGTRITYQLVVTNGGPSHAVGALVEVLAPATLSAFEWTCAATPGSSCTPGPATGALTDSVTVLAGGSLTYMLSAAIDPAALGDLVTEARVRPALGTDDSQPDNDRDSDIDGLAPETDLELTKSDAVDPLPSGTPLVYTLSVFNRGPSDALDVVVTDALPPELTLVVTDGCAEDPAGAPACTLGTIPAGGTASYTLEVAVAPSPPATVTNRATVSGRHPETDPGDNEAEEVTGLDAVAPEVVEVGVEDGPSLVPCDSIRAPVRALEITFSEAMVAGATEPGSVTVEDAYRLVTAPTGEDFDTTSCAGGTGGDLVTTLDEVAYDADRRRATLLFGNGFALDDGLHRLLVCGSVTDLAGNPLDGGAGSGSDLSATFRIDRHNLLADASFDRFDPDCGLDAWQSPDPGQIELSSPDVDGSPLSGSVHGVDPLLGLAVEQCVEVPEGRALQAGAALRIEAAAAATVGTSLDVTFFDGPECSGAELGQRVFATALIGPSGGWLPLTGEVSSPASASSARYRVILDAPFADAFDGYLDAAFLGSRMLFSDGFESGDTSAWSVTVP